MTLKSTSPYLYVAISEQRCVRRRFIIGQNAVVISNVDQRNDAKDNVRSTPKVMLFVEKWIILYSKQSTYYM